MSVSGFTTIRTARLYLALHVQGQLLSQEQILGGEVGTRPYRRREQAQDVAGDAQDGSDRPAGLFCGPQVSADLNHVRWVSHCRDLVQLPVAA